MNGRKLHISPLLQLGIAVMLMVCCLVAAVGVSFARYQADTKEGLIFQPNPNARVYLGSVKENGFVCEQSHWVLADGQLQLAFAIGNGTAAEDFSTVDQTVSLRVVASLGAWNPDAAPLRLTVGEETCTAVAQRIQSDSLLYSQFGEGWVFRFVDADGNEMTWSLPGGELNYLSMLLQADAAADTGLLRLQAVAAGK